MMDHFAPLPSLLGGTLIGLAASILLLFNGRIAGISGIVAGLLVPERREARWRVSFVAGLVAGGLALRAFYPATMALVLDLPPAAVVLAGFLVGVGTRLGNGCTSGHGVCGISRGSLRSVWATLTFMVGGGITVAVVRHLLQGAT
jgi:uncharacterized membrane protein YedE/YeeE